VNFDVPMQAEDYVHRIGRTGRAERLGQAITFVSELDRRRAGDIERLVGTVEKIELEGFPYKPIPTGDGRGRRPSGGGSRPSRGSAPRGQGGGGRSQGGGGRPKGGRRRGGGGRGSSGTGTGGGAGSGGAK